MIVLRVCYKSGLRFDEGYYVAKHLPLSKSVCGPYGLKRIEMVKFGPAPDGAMRGRFTGVRRRWGLEVRSRRTVGRSSGANSSTETIRRQKKSAYAIDSR